MKSYKKAPDMAVDDETKSTNNNKQKQIEKKKGGEAYGLRGLLASCIFNKELLPKRYRESLQFNKEKTLITPFL